MIKKKKKEEAVSVKYTKQIFYKVCQSIKAINNGKIVKTLHLQQTQGHYF